MSPRRSSEGTSRPLALFSISHRFLWISNTMRTTPACPRIEADVIFICRTSVGISIDLCGVFLFLFHSTGWCIEFLVIADEHRHTFSRTDWDACWTENRVSFIWSFRKHFQVWRASWAHSILLVIQHRIILSIICDPVDWIFILSLILVWTRLKVVLPTLNIRMSQQSMIQILLWNLLLNRNAFPTEITTLIFRIFNSRQTTSRSWTGLCPWSSPFVNVILLLLRLYSIVTFYLWSNVRQRKDSFSFILMYSVLFCWLLHSHSPADYRSFFLSFYNKE